MVELAAMFDLHADEWQERVLVGAGGERDDGKHAAKEVGVVVPRQNGKDGILEMRTLGGLLILEEKLITYSAHQFDTSLEAFRRLRHYFENYDDLSRRVKRVINSHGEEGIELLSGQRVRFRTRTSGGGRGFTGDCLFLNEAMILRESSMGALFFTLSARPNPQVWYTGSAVDQDVHEHGVVLSRVRSRAQKGEPNLAYFEWAAGEKLEDLDPDDRDGWYRANPALGKRISEETVETEQRATAPKTFAVERLGVGDWFDLDFEDDERISAEQWKACEAEEITEADGPVVLSFDVRPDRKAASIAAAGVRTDGLRHMKVLEHHPGTGWVVGRLKALVDELDAEVVVDERGPAASLFIDIENAGIELIKKNGTDYAAACGSFYDAVVDEDVRHDGAPELALAVRNASRRPLGDAWAWSRKGSSVDISPLVACTLALWAVKVPEPRLPVAVWG
jgi:phage terminase large subunit-like protein